MKFKPTIFLIDTDSSSRKSTYGLLFDNGFHVEPFESLNDLFIHRLSPRLTLVHDIKNVVMNFAERLEGMGEPWPFACFTRDLDTQRVVNAVRNGAMDYFSLPSEEMAVPERLTRLRASLTDTSQHRRNLDHTRKLVSELTARERQVLECVSLGMSNRAIAAKYQISPRTVEIHRAKMISKLGAANSPEAVKIAVSAGIAL
jgi:FixJ family two-component response regulator